MMLSFILGTQIHWAISIPFIIGYILYVSTTTFIVRRKSNKYLRQSHFALAIFCRAHNNKTYMRKEIRLKPGYLAKWIEIKFLDREAEAEERRLEAELEM